MTRGECNLFYIRNAIVLVALILFSWIPLVRCRLHQLLFQLRYCERGNSDGTIDVLADPNEWLADNPTVARAVVWESPGGNLHPYAEWTREEKHDLYTAFWKARMDEETGIHEAPADARPETVGRADTTYFPTASAWRLFIAYVGQSLAAENARWVVWSLTSYTPEQLVILFDSRAFFVWQSDVRRYAINRYLSGEATPGDPVRTFRFLRRNRMIGSTSRQTVENLLEWCRSLIHFDGGLDDLANRQDYWQYSGATPVERVINGTVRTSDRFMALRRYTAGCYGTTGFLRAVLRTVNLPVGFQLKCLHAQPAFLRDGLYLSHGDDPYARLGFFNPPRPVGELLIDEATYLSWFGPGVPDERVCINVGRRPVDLSLSYPTSNFLLRSRCDDIASGRSREESDVYDSYRGLYTLDSLELRNLWGRIDEEIERHGGCSNIPPN